MCAAPDSIAKNNLPHYKPINALALIRGMFHGVSSKPQPGIGVFPSDWLQTTFLASAVRRYTGTKALHDFSLHYGESAGDSGLRRALSKKLGSLNVPALLKKAMAWCIDQGQLRRRAERIRARRDVAKARSARLALSHGCTFAAEPAGLFGWVDSRIDTEALAQRMLDEGYLLAPGALFYATRQPSALMRISFATTQDAVR